MIEAHVLMSKMNPYGEEAFDLGMRTTLTFMLTGQLCPLYDTNSHKAIKYVSERVSVPGDMNIWSSKRFRQACEDTISIS